MAIHNVSLVPYPPQLMVVTMAFFLYPKRKRYPEVSKVIESEKQK
jgi:hypothetical protein